MLNYIQIGNKKSANMLVFIHGSGCNSSIFGEIQKYLNDYNCILIDLNGHGSSKGECSTDLQGYIDNVYDFLRNSEVTKTQSNISLIGYSMGGGIVLGVALKKLANVKKVVVLSGGARFNKLNKAFMKKIHNNKVDKLYLLRCLGNYFNPLTYRYMKKLEKSTQIIINDLEACEKFDISGEIKDIKIPVKIIVARDEILTILEYSEEIHKMINNSTLKIFEKGRHFLLIVKSREVSEEIEDFILN
jgi:pimeloyl-ACP methyl ester carboxylesterase